MAPFYTINWHFIDLNPTGDKWNVHIKTSLLIYQNQWHTPITKAIITAIKYDTCRQPLQTRALYISLSLRIQHSVVQSNHSHLVRPPSIYYYISCTSCVHVVCHVYSLPLEESWVSLLRVSCRHCYKQS